MGQTAPDSERPLVSIAIPTYDRLQYLKEAVASALSQTYERVEVIIGDDGPTNSIRAWCETVAMRDARVRYRRNARNLGLAGNWNALADRVCRPLKEAAHARSPSLLFFQDPPLISKLANH